MSNWWQPLIGVVVGWVLGQSTEWWNRRRRARRYKQAIYVELMDVHSAVKIRISAMREMLKEFLMHRTMSNVLANIPYTIFKSHFVEISLQFTESERLALSHIYVLIDSLNFNFSIIRDNWDIISGNKKRNDENLRRMVQVTEGSYKNAREIDMMIELLLRDRERHDIRDVQSAERLGRISSEADTELRALIGECESIPGGSA
jgi:hypothetical protein